MQLLLRASVYQRSYAPCLFSLVSLGLVPHLLSSWLPPAREILAQHLVASAPPRPVSTKLTHAAAVLFILECMRRHGRQGELWRGRVRGGRAGAAGLQGVRGLGPVKRTRIKVGAQEGRTENSFKEEIPVEEGKLGHRPVGKMVFQ